MLATVESYLNVHSNVCCTAKALETAQGCSVETSLALMMAAAKSFANAEVRIGSFQ